MIEIRQSGVHGQGAFAVQDLLEGQRIGAYEGRRYTARQASRRTWDNELTYVFGLSDGSLIDASAGGNATRHLNHSCAPNCIAFEETGPDGELVIVFYALCSIGASQELLLDYSLDVDASEDRNGFRCTCGAVACRGTMLALA